MRTCGIEAATRSFERRDHEHIRSNRESTRSAHAINQDVRDIGSRRDGVNVAFAHELAIRSEDRQLLGPASDASRSSALTTRSRFVVWVSIAPLRPSCRIPLDAVETILE